MPTGLRVAPILLLVLVSGCAGEANKNATPVQGNDPDADLGSIGGIVTNEERVPVGFARVVLVGGAQQTDADAGGRFVFLKLPAGEYTLRASAGGHEPAEQQVSLAPGENALVSVALTALPGPEAYYVTEQYTAHHACMLYTLLYVTHCSAPYTTAYESLKQQGVDPGTYGAPPDVLENTYRHNFTVGPNSTGVVSELAWEANADATRYMWFVVSCAWYDPVSDGCAPPDGSGAEPPFAGKRGPSPLRLEWQHPRPDWLPWIMAKARVSGDIDQYAGASIDQRLDMYNTVFYGGPVPEDWSLFPPTP